MFINMICTLIRNKKRFLRPVKKAFTLLELLVACVLTAVLLSFLTYFYSQISLTDHEIETLRVHESKISYLETKLHTLAADIEAIHGKKEKFFFSTTADTAPYVQQDSPTLLFRYNNRADMYPELASIVIGRLFVDTDHRLVLVTAPIPTPQTRAQPIAKREVLYEGVERLALWFFPMDEKNPAAGGCNTWPRDYKRLPALVKITLALTNGETLTIPLHISHVENPIRYGVL